MYLYKFFDENWKITCWKKCSDDEFNLFFQTFGAGFQEAATLLTPVKGKLQLDDVNFILSQYKINPSYETLMDISDKNGLDSKKLSNVFQYVKIFRLHEGSKLAAEEEQKNQIQATTVVMVMRAHQ